MIPRCTDTSNISLACAIAVMTKVTQLTVTLCSSTSYFATETQCGSKLVPTDESLSIENLLRQTLMVIDISIWL